MATGSQLGGLTITVGDAVEDVTWTATVGVLLAPFLSCSSCDGDVGAAGVLVITGGVATDVNEGTKYNTCKNTYSL